MFSHALRQALDSTIHQFAKDGSSFYYCVGMFILFIMASYLVWVMDGVSKMQSRLGTRQTSAFKIFYFGYISLLLSKCILLNLKFYDTGATLTGLWMIWIIFYLAFLCYFMCKGIQLSFRDRNFIFPIIILLLVCIVVDMQDYSGVLSRIAKRYGGHVDGITLFSQYVKSFNELFLNVMVYGSLIFMDVMALLIIFRKK